VAQRPLAMRAVRIGPSADLRGPCDALSTSPLSPRPSLACPSSATRRGPTS